MPIDFQVKREQFTAFIGLSSLVGLIFVSLPVGTGDTAELIEASVGFFSCLTEPGSQNCNGLERFGFTPHLISALLLTIHPNPDVIILLWSFLNFIIFLILIYFFWNLFNSIKSSLVSNIFIVGTIFSPLIAYGVYSFSEIAFIGLSILFLHLLYKKQYFLSLIPGILAISYKDNTFLILIPLSLVILLLTNTKKINYIFVLVTSLSGLLINFLFNFLRYSHFARGEYQDGGAFIQPAVNLNYFFAIWLSPSGGVLGYLHLLPMILLIYLVKNYFNSSKQKKLIIILLIFSILLTNLNLSLWFSPFGWIAWGPRLFLPALILFIYSTFLFIKNNNHFDKFNWNWSYIYFLFSYVMFISAAGFLINPGIWATWYEQNRATGRFCSEPPIWENDPSAFIECTQAMMWTFNSIPSLSIHQVLTAVGLYNDPQRGIDYVVAGLITGVTIYFISLLWDGFQGIRKCAKSSN